MRKTWRTMAMRDGAERDKVGSARMQRKRCAAGNRLFGQTKAGLDENAADD
jgi:hypothetical protein